MRRFFSLFRTLQWKLTFTYARAMGFVFLFFTVILPVLFMLVLMMTGIAGQQLSAMLRPVFLHEAAMYFDEPIPDTASLQHLVERSCRGIYSLQYFVGSESIPIDCKEGGLNIAEFLSDDDDVGLDEVLRQYD